MIQVEELRYTYPGQQHETLRGIDFEVGPGEIFGFLGPSGAGKSTTQKLCIGLMRGYEGSVRVLDRQMRAWGREVYERLGVCFELPNHYLKLTARENLSYFASLYRGPTYAPDDLLAWVGLTDHADRRVAEFSKGMKVRLNLARSLVHRPELLFLDEPTGGLDPVNAQRVKELLLRLRDEHGMSAFVTTHDMAVADTLCDRVAFLSGGAIRAMDSPEALKRRYGQRTIAVTLRAEPQSEAVVREFSMDGLGQDEGFLSALREASAIEAIHSQETTLERIFIEVTGEELSG